MRISVIYRIIHIDSGRCYIGQTSEECPLDRWTNHISYARCRHAGYLASVIRKYGKESFDFQIIEFCDQRDANELEQYWIAINRSNEKGFGFNLSPGGCNSHNSMTEEVRKKISLSKTGVKTDPCPPERRLAISKAKLNAGYTHSNQARKNISKGRSGYAKLTDSHKESIRAGLRKKLRSKLTEAEILEILSKLDLTDLALSRQYGVSRKMIWRIRNGKIATFSSDTRKSLHP